MADKGDIYLGRYEGWYSVRDEAYYGEEELVVADSGEKLSPQGTLGRMDGRGKLVLPPLGLSGEAARSLRGQSRLHPARDSPQRGAALRRGRPRRPLHLAHQLRLGCQGPGQPEPCHVRLAGRAHQLSDRHWISRRYRGLSEILASRSPHHRQGCRSLPRRLLAGFPDVGRYRPAQAGVRPRLPPPPRREDVQVARQRRRAGRPDPRLRSRPAALFPAPRSDFRPGRRLHGRGDRHQSQCRSRQQLRQPRPAHLVVHRPQLRRRGARRREGGSGRRGAAGARPRHGPQPRSPPISKRWRSASASRPGSRRSSPATNISTARRPGRSARPIRSG